MTTCRTSGRQACLRDPRAIGSTQYVANALTGHDQLLQIDASFEREAFDEREVEQLIEQTIEGLLPALIGDITGEAIRIALTGDEDAAAELEARAERMETAIERDVEARAERLEKRAEALCPSVADLDGIESSLDLRLADNQPLDLVRLDRD